MSIVLTINGAAFNYPETDDVDWGGAATAWASAVTSGMLQKAGGDFTLLADVNFGPNFGLLSSYFTSRTANVSSAGILRLAAADSIGFRNAANSANLLLGLSSDILQFNGENLIAGLIVNAEIATGAAIDADKIANGFVDNTEFQYLNGVTSSIQTQLNVKLDDFAATTDNALVRADGAGGTAVQGSAVILDDSANLTGVALLDLDTVEAAEITTPSTPGAGKRKLYAKTDGFYELDATGTELKVGAGGSGSGEINTILDSSTAANWSVSGAGIAVATTTTTAELPLAEIIDTAIKITPSSGTPWVRYRWIMPVGLRNTKLKLAWVQRALSGYLTGDLTVEVQTNTASDYSGSYTKLSLASDSAGVTSIANASGGFSTSYDATDALYYELRIVRVAGTSAISLVNVVSGPGITAQGAAISEWQSYDPNPGASAWTVSTYSGRWRRVGSSAEIRVALRCTGNPAVNASMNFAMPPNMTIDVTALDPVTLAPIGYGACWNNGIALCQSTMHYSTTTSFRPRQIINIVGEALEVSDTYPFTFDNLDAFSGQIFVPISQWQGSGTVNLFANGEEFSWNSDTANSNNAVAFGYGPDGVAIGSYASATRLKRVRFITPIQVTDVVEIEIRVGADRWLPIRMTALGGVMNTTQGMQLIVINSTDVDVAFGASGYPPNLQDGGSTWSNIATTRWRVRKSVAGQAVGFGAASLLATGLVKLQNSLIAVSGGSGSGSTNTSVRRFTTIDTNLGGADITFTQSASLGDLFTLNTAGVYSVAYSDGNLSAGANLGITFNSTGLSTNPASIASLQCLARGFSAVGSIAFTSITRRFAAGSIIRGQITTGDFTDIRVQMSVTKISD